MAEVHGFCEEGDRIFQCFREWPILATQDSREKNDHLREEVGGVRAHSAEEIPPETIYFSAISSFIHPFSWKAKMVPSGAFKTFKP